MQHIPSRGLHSVHANAFALINEHGLEAGSSRERRFSMLKEASGFALAPIGPANRPFSTISNHLIGMTACDFTDKHPCLKQTWNDYKALGGGHVLHDRPGNRGRPVQPLGDLHATREAALCGKAWQILPGTLSNAFQTLAESMKPHIMTWRTTSARLCLAVKCMPDRGVISTLAALGAGFDCASVGEVELVRELGVPARRIILAHPVKRPCDLRCIAVGPARCCSPLHPAGRRLVPGHPTGMYFSSCQRTHL